MHVQAWLTYFSLNATTSRDIPWGLGADLPADEGGCLVPSLQEFQIGENADGSHLRAATASWAEDHDDELLARTVDLFIAEEQRHAAELARFLSINGHPVRSRNAGDSAFRLLRHLGGGLEGPLSVLLTAEIIGYLYYGAVRAGTRSTLLRSICDTFLRDEALHLIFHFEQLARMRRHRSHAGLWATQAASRLLMGGACAVVWARHRRVLQRGHLTFSSFLEGCLSRLTLVTQNVQLIPKDGSLSSQKSS